MLAMIAGAKVLQCSDRNRYRMLAVRPIPISSKMSEATKGSMIANALRFRAARRLDSIALASTSHFIFNLRSGIRT